MMGLHGWCALVALMTFLSTPAWSADEIQRFTLVVGANSGGDDRTQLRYAVTDAERFARVMADLGGVKPGNEIILKQPNLSQLTDAFNLLNTRVADARRGGESSRGGRTEVIVYYSGHADEKGLLLGEDRYSYQTLRDRLDEIPADVRIAVLDACASGAFTRIKGGRKRPPFLVDEASNMRGHAFLTSSAATEAAQESDRIRASYFTHYLVSGFRGAADMSGDGKVTLNEAYHFAFTETLGRTVNTRGGAQHPSYDINLSGTGDVVMTDVRQTTATLVLGAELEGRFFIRTSNQDLVVELYKPHGRVVELGVEPGSYEIRLERSKASLVASTDVRDGARLVIDPAQFGPAAVEAARPRGDVEHRRLVLAGRNRVELRFGSWRGDGSTSEFVPVSGVITTRTDGVDMLVGMRYTRYFSEQLAMTLGVDVYDVQVDAEVGNGVISTQIVQGLFVPVGVEWNPIDRAALGWVRPYVSASIGPVIGDSSASFVGNGTIATDAISRTTVGGTIVGSVDFHVTNAFSMGLSAGYHWMRDFSEPVGGRDNFNAVQVVFGLGWVFGKGRSAP